jgi:pimeloyl-ACP methyl ester carboxylesterase
VTKVINYKTARREPRFSGPERPFRVTAERLPIWRELFAGLDWLALRVSSLYYGHGVKRGDGSPVVVVPGLLGTDAYLAELRNWLSRIGYRAFRSRIGRNSDCPRVMVERLVHTLEAVHRGTGRRVTLVGHSLGGLVARGAAIRRPDLVSQVISVGSPINGVRAHPLIIAAARRTASDCGDDCLAWTQGRLPVGVKEASIYSRSDGVVGWLSCLPADGSQSIEVRSTHSGLVVNHQAYAALAALLGRAEETQGALRLIRAPRVRVLAAIAS